MPIATGDTIEASHIIGHVNTSTGTTSVVITTLAGERLNVFVKGTQSADGGTIPTVSLRYDGVTKDSFTWTNPPTKGPFALMYSEVPGAQTSKTIDVVTSAGSLSDVKIIVMKISTG